MKKPPFITPTCGHPSHREPLRIGEINYTAQQINELLSLIPDKADKKEVFPNDSYLGHFPMGAQLPDMDRFAWAFVGDLDKAHPYFYYPKSNVPQGYQPGWNDMAKEFGTYLLTPGKQDQLTAEELFKEKFRLPELTADRAIADEHGNRITDTYVKREAVANHIKQIYNQQFLDNPPLITEGYITPEMLSEETKQMLENTGQEITNLPDGEDLQSVHGVLKFADKQYNPNSYSGLGRRILRKNIVNGVNLLTQNMISKPNTIYVIQYKFDLNGAEITIPEGCVLDFQGGSLSNGCVAMNYTSLKGDVRFNKVDLKGNINCNELLLDWFELNDGEDTSTCLQSLINVAKNQVIINIGLTKRLIKQSVIINKPITIKGYTYRNFYQEGVDLINSSLYTDADIDILVIKDTSFVCIDGVAFFGKSKDINNNTGVRDGEHSLIRIEYSNNCKISNCIFKNSHIGLYAKSAGTIQVNNNGFTCCNCGLYLDRSGDGTFTNNYINVNTGLIEFSKDNVSDINGVGIYIFESGNLNIIGGKIEWNTKGVVVDSGRGINMLGIQFDKNRDGHIFYNSINIEPDSSNLCNLITSCRFLGTKSDFHIWINYWNTSKFNIVGNTFTKNGNRAIDTSSDNGAYPDYIFKIIENHEYVEYVFKCYIKFIGNTHHRMLYLCNGEAYKNDLIQFISDDNSLPIIGKGVVLNSFSSIKTYSQKISGITIYLKKSSNIVTCRICGTSTEKIEQAIIIPDVLNVSSILAVLWQPGGVNNYDNYLQSRAENSLLFSIEKGKSVDVTIPFFSTNLM